MYFADHNPELAKAVQEGRAEFVRQFPSLASAEAQARVPVPHDPQTFERCKLDWDERETHHTWVRLHRDLLALRRTEAAFPAQDGPRRGRVGADMRQEEDVMAGQSGTVDVAAVAGTGPGLVRIIRWDPTDDGRRVLAEKEWLVTNGLGGYASGTLSGALTRRY